MRTLAEGGIRSLAFWLIVISAALGNIVNAATTPVLSRLVQEQLGGDAALAGLLVSLSGFASIATMPLAGVLADRVGVRKVLLVSTAVALVGLATILVSLSTPSVFLSRVLFGGGNAGVATALTAWVVAVIPAERRGRALGLFGLNVWVGLALGPIIGESLYRDSGYVAVWAASFVLQAAALVLASFVRKAPRSTTTGIAHAPGERRGQWILVARTITAPGVVALAAWAAEGLMVAFLIQHLEGHGIASTGLLGAANVFAIFAASVILTRLALAGLPDRWGPTPTARAAMVVLAAGLAIFAFADSFALAAVGAVLVGAGYSPLYPALTLLATNGLPSSVRSSAIGLFSAMTSVGYSAGALLGGVLIAAFDSRTSFLVLAAAQVAVIALLRTRRPEAPTEVVSTPVAPEPR